MDTILSASFLTALFASGVRQSIPLIYGSVGDAVSERAGVMGISLEGEMLFGAFFSAVFIGVLNKLWYILWNYNLIGKQLFRLHKHPFCIDGFASAVKFAIFPGQHAAGCFFKSFRSLPLVAVKPSDSLQQ